MEDKRKSVQEEEGAPERPKSEERSDQPTEGPKSEDWYTQALEELDDFIESQGIYIRQ